MVNPCTNIDMNLRILYQKNKMEDDQFTIILMELIIMHVQRHLAKSNSSVESQKFYHDILELLAVYRHIKGYGKNQRCPDLGG